MKIGIIGAGIAGIATAIRLAARGHEVTVFEANAYPGGKLSAFELDGYRFDAGPSLFTMPQYVEALFEAADEPIDDYFRYQRVPCTCNYFWPDGTTLRAWAEPAAFAREAEQKLGVPAAKVEAFLAKSARKYALAGNIFLEKSLHRLSTWLNWKALKATFYLPYFDLFTSMHRVHTKWFRSAKMVQLFDRFATYNGSNPYKAPGMLTIIPHFEHNIGVFYPEGGMHSITQSLYALALKKGVVFHFNSPVEAILTENDRVNGLKTNQDTFAFDGVVSNMDVFYTYRKLLPNLPAPERILGQPKSSSALIFYWGVKQAFPQMDLHNIFFTENYQAEFEAIEQGYVTDDPTIYVNITSKYTATDAPEGAESWFVMVNVPCNSGQDWDALIPGIRQKTIDKLSKALDTDLAALIACESILDPRGIEQKTASHLGALYGYSSNNQMAAFLRHPNFSSRLKNLYFVGGSVHPGGGIPLCLLSAQITEALIEEAGSI